MNGAEALRPTFDRIQRNGLVAGIVGLVASIVGLFFWPAQFFESYLWAYLFWSGIAIGCLGILLLHNVVGGNWGVVIRRFAESGASTLFLAAIGLIPIFIGMHWIYTWTDPILLKKTANVGIKATYLSSWFFIVRSVVYVVVWMFWGYRLLRWSDEQDRTGDPDRFIQARMKRFSAPGLLIFGFTTSWAFIDWVMSLEPAWYSTVFPWMFTIGEMLLTFSFVIALLILLRHHRPFAGVVNFQHYNDLGNLMLCFTMLWAYLMLAQFLIIWSENLPEEIPWYLRRFSNGWGYLAFFIAIFHFCVPFFLLLMRFIKRNPNLLLWVAIWMIGIRIIDEFWIVMPSFRQRYLSVSWMDVAAFIGVGGIWFFFFMVRLKSRPLLPLHDPRLGYHVLEVEA